ncbi:hypothetical protein GcC1_086021 [Golovinomyces cichoracearum]|uniref:Uncharacterized protein n=1 Tax=Golovinomyces cichoracearum TaxID=62708 RepID=A0A420II11_9PEZI|nr:hypothetical protein GcC1_086021 [Golovinomyces cichoracearum]
MTVPCPQTKDCTTCACTKAHEIISRRPDVEFPAPPNTVFHRTNQDIIPFEPSYTGHNHATHTQCDTSRYAVLDTHRGKAVACQASINQIKMIETQFDVRENKLGFEDFEEWPQIYDTDNNVFGPGEDENELGPLFKNSTSHGDASGHSLKIKLLPTPSPSPERQEVDQRQDSIHNSSNNILTERGLEKPLPKG